MSGNRYALIISNSQYQNKTLRQLVAPKPDAEDLKRVLIDPAIGAFQDVEILSDKERGYLEWAIQEFFTRFEQDDTLLLYFSGHGIRHEYSGELYLATINTDPKLLKATAISARFIREIMGDVESRAERKILILDCCYSGAFTNEILTKGEAKKVAVGQQFDTAKGTVILTASTALQYAFEKTRFEKLSEESPSLFTRFLVQGLVTGEAARENATFITVTDLFRYAERQMRQAQVPQTPQLTAIDQREEIIIANSVRPRIVTLPKGILQLLKSSNLVDRLVAITELRGLTRGEDRDLAQLAIEELEKLCLHEGDLLVQRAAQAALAELNIQPPEMRFTSGAQAKSVEEWVKLAERCWDEAREVLYSGSLEKWLAYINLEKLASKAEYIRQTEPDKSIGLELFLCATGLVKSQTKRDAKTNLENIINQLNYWDLRKQKSRRTFALQIFNSGRGYLHGTVRSNVEWLHLPKSGNFGCLSGQFTTVEVVFIPEKFNFWQPTLQIPLNFSID